MAVVCWIEYTKATQHLSPHNNGSFNTNLDSGSRSHTSQQAKRPAISNERRLVPMMDILGYLCLFGFIGLSEIYHGRELAVRLGWTDSVGHLSQRARHLES